MLLNNRIKLLWICQTLFLARVLGQVYVAFRGVDWLPAMEEWYSGLLPYTELLTSQIVILMLMTVVNYCHSVGSGVFIARRAGSRKTLVILSAIYATVLVLRYVIGQITQPENGLFHHAIPISLHFVLAFYLYLLSSSPPED